MSNSVPPKEMGQRRSRQLLPFDFCAVPFDFPLGLLPNSFRLQRAAFWPVISAQSQTIQSGSLRRQRCFLPSAFCLLSAAFCLLLTTNCFAQEPYAAIDPAAVKYNGTGRDLGHDLTGPEIRVGLLAPLTGSRQGEGEALRRAAEMAIEEENAASSHGRPHLALVARDESGPWGRVSGEIVHMVFDDRDVALITSSDGASAHLAEQVANKIGVPVLTLASDATTTEINLPWIFRMGPADAPQAQLIARDIYQNRKLSRVLLIIQNDHDGRVGGEGFEKAARAMKAPEVMQVTVDPDQPTAAPIPTGIEGVQAVVFWTDAATAHLLAPRLRQGLPSGPIYLCSKAAQFAVSNNAPVWPGGSDGAGIWTAGSAGVNSPAQSDFTARYRQRFGEEPSLDAARVYDAVHLLATSLRQSGANRARLRDALAGTASRAGASGRISFDHAGNDTAPVALQRLP